MKNNNKVHEIKRSASNKYKELLRDYASSVLFSTQPSFFPWHFKGNVGKKSDSFEESLEQKNNYTLPVRIKLAMDTRLKLAKFILGSMESRP